MSSYSCLVLDLARFLPHAACGDALAMCGWCVQLFSDQSAAAAARGAGGAGAPAPLKFHLKLGGFGSAVQLDDEGRAMDYSPYRSILHPCFPRILLYA